MDSLVGYGSDEENDTERYDHHHHHHHFSGSHGASESRRREDDTNYDEVNMDLSEESRGGESEPELPPAEHGSASKHRGERRDSHNNNCGDSNRRDSRSSEQEKQSERRDRRPPSPAHRHDRERRDDRHARSDRRHEGSSSSRRGLLGDKPDDNKSTDSNRMPALMDLKPFGGDPPPVLAAGAGVAKPHDTRDAASPRFVDRDRRDRDRERERERERDKHGRRSAEKRSGYRQTDRRSRSRDRGERPKPRNSDTSSNDRRGSPPHQGEYRPSSYKVNKKLEVMEKMGLQIKTPDGSMATAQQLRQAACEPNSPLPSYYNPSAVNTTKILDQVQKRKLLWSNKPKTAAAEGGAWTGTRFAQDNNGKQAEKFMRLMGIKDPNATTTESPPDKTADPIKKQEEMFQAMQAQYEVARATTHTMRGVGLGFQRGQF